MSICLLPRLVLYCLFRTRSPCDVLRVVSLPQVRAHWLSHADIYTHTQPIMPVWASPMFHMHTLPDTPTPAVGVEGGGDSNDSASNAPAACSVPDNAPLSMEDLFVDTTCAAPVHIRRAGPQAMVPPTTLSPMTVGDLHGGGNGDAWRYPAPSAPSLACTCSSTTGGGRFECCCFFPFFRFA